MLELPGASDQDRACVHLPGQPRELSTRISCRREKDRERRSRRSAEEVREALVKLVEADGARGKRGEDGEVRRELAQVSPPGIGFEGMEGRARDRTPREPLEDKVTFALLAALSQGRELERRRAQGPDRARIKGEVALQRRLSRVCTQDGRRSVL